MGPEWDFETAELETLLWTLIPHVKRWKALTLSEWTTEAFYPALLSAAADQLPLACLNLARLDMRVPSLEGDTETRSGKQLFDPGESWLLLRSASFSQSHPHIRNHLLAWEMLSELELVGIHYIDLFLLEFHPELTGLQTLKFIDCLWYFPPPIDAGPFCEPLATYRLPRLRTLYSRNTEHGLQKGYLGTLPIFSWITTHFLKDIVMEWIQPEDIAPLVSLIGVRKWSILSFQCKLLTTVQSFLPALQAMSGLQDLTLELIPDDEHRYPGMEFFALAQALICLDYGDFKNCPQLHRLRIRLPHGAEEEQLLFGLRILKKRSPKESASRRVQSKLVSVRFWYRSEKDWEKLTEAKEVLALQDAGMAVTFHKL